MREENEGKKKERGGKKIPKKKVQNRTGIIGRRGE